MGKAAKQRASASPGLLKVPVAPFTPPTWAVLAALVALAAVVGRHTLGGFFALDDLILFQQAAGVRPWPLTLWRWLSGWAWFRAVVPLWGHVPAPYHVASLVLHVVNVLLLHRLAKRWGASSVAAFVGAGLFAASRLHFPALFAATSIGELLALTLTLAALLLEGTGRRAWLALGVFALALSAKESVLLVPCVALFVAPSGGPAAGTLRERARGLAPLVAGGAALGALLLAIGLGSGRLTGQAYTVSLGANLVENVARLFGWTIDLGDPIPDLHATTTGAAHWLLPTVAVVLTVLVFRTRAAPLLRAGVAWWWLAVLPVLPLPGRTYLFYLYVPLAGVALALAALVDRALAALAARARAKPSSGRGRWIMASLVLLLYAAWSDVLQSVRTDLRMTSTDWPLDPVLRKSELARRAIDDTRAALAGRRASVAILIPASISHAVNLGSGQVAPDTPIRRYELEQVLDSGRSVQALVPEADSVTFVHDYEPGRVGWLMLLSRSDSHLVPLGVLPAAHARFVAAMLASQMPRAALDYAEKALADRPDDAALRALRDQAAAAAGER